MHWLTVVGLGVASNLDSLGIGFAVGTKGKQVSLTANLVMTLIIACISFLSLWAGSWITSFLPLWIANRAGGVLIFVAGVYTVVTDLVKKQKENRLPEPDDIDKDRNNKITWNESITLGFLLSLNNIGVSIGAGVTGIRPFLTTISMGVFSFLFIGLGTYYGMKLNRWKIGKHADVVSGLILVAIGLHESFF